MEVIKTLLLLLLFAHSIKGALEGFGINLPYFNALQLVVSLGFLFVLIRLVFQG